MPDMMQAVEITKAGGPEVLAPVTRPMPIPRAGEVVIRLRHAGVNRPDVLQRAGLYAPPPGASDLPGLEGAGEIVALGAGVSTWRVGDKVCALLPGGGYAQYVRTQAAHCLPIPAGMDMAQAACLPETFFTVWSNVFMRGGLQPGERFLVHGGSSGIGTTAIQLASAFGATVYATAGSADKCAACLALGATRAFNYRNEDWSAGLAAEGGVDVILDMVGGSYLARNLTALADDGRLVQIAFLEGSKVTANLAPVLMRRLTFTGSTLRPQSDAAKAAIAAALHDKVWPMLAAGRIMPVIDSHFALADAAAAHARMESSGHIGKIVLDIP